ncbi:NAD(P)/FAD-dependent oxidoreductase [Nocardia thailandica]|uniref:NAD(P)/FAD-dependent oxidoreductase n=1 Tax=Nocardia thailandica TaxID=257275 RepID=UPI0002E2C4F4|nr:FAD-dependent oxidoreductase [Nocardia thailandica]
MTGQQHIVVLGAGYAGLAAARGLVRRTRGTRVTVVDARAEFVERVRLHQRASGQDIATRDLRDVLGARGIDFVRGRATRIDPADKTVQLADGAVLAYDTLVYALGSTAAVEVPGAAAFARTVATPEEAPAVWAAARGTGDGPVVIVGTGSTGIELAAELAESRPDSRIVLLGAEEPGAWLSPRAAVHLRAALARLGVEIRTGAKVVEVLADGVRLADGTCLPAALTIWTAGFAVPDLAARAGLAVDARGRVRTDDTLRSISHPDIYAAGDAALIAGPAERPLRMACATAIPTGAHAARAIAARLRGAEPRPLRFRYAVQCLSLGRRDGLIQVLRADDTPRSPVLTGRPAARVKELVVRGAAWSVGMR